jgi:hypothetical protein
MSPDAKRPPVGPPADRSNTTTADRLFSAELEALTFSEAARSWLDHLVVGDTPTLEGIDAAQILLYRAKQFALVAV